MRPPEAPGAPLDPLDTRVHVPTYLDCIPCLLGLNGGPRPSWERDNLAYIEQQTLERTGPLEHRVVPRPLPLIAKRNRGEGVGWEARSSNEENLGWKGLSSLISSEDECKDCWPFCGGYRETGLTRIASRRRLVFVALSRDTRRVPLPIEIFTEISIQVLFKKRSFYSSSSSSLTFIIAHWFHFLQERKVIDQFSIDLITDM